MITKAPKLTDAGESLLIRAIGGEEITFTKFKIGNGETSSDGKTFTDLINPLLEFGISEIDDTNEGFLTVNGHFDNSDIETDFQLREFGLFAKGEDDIETLYCYVNDGENGGYLRANEGDVIAEQDISLIVAIGEAEHVTAIITPGTLYAAKSDFDDHVADDDNPHSVTAAQVGLGNVPNVTTNNQTPTYTVAGSNANLSSGEKLSVAFGKIAKAISSLISHLSNTNNPHGVTRAQLGAAAASHNHSASEINSGTLGVTRGGTGLSSYASIAQAIEGKLFDIQRNVQPSTNLNNYTAPGLYYSYLGNTNNPNANYSFFVLVLKTSTNSISQIALQDGGGNTIYQRTRIDSSWDSWG